MLFQFVEAAVGYVFSGPLVGFGGPVVFLEVERKGAVQTGEFAEDLDAGIDYFGTDAVGSYCGDGVFALCCAGRHDDVGKSIQAM